MKSEPVAKPETAINNYNGDKESYSPSGDPNEAKLSLKVNVMPSLTAALAKLSTNSGTTPSAVLNGATDASKIVQCENFGCSAKKSIDELSSELELIEDCLHHPKPPIFHEGLQFWGCCQKKHTDFEKMRNQPGCTHGKHKWTRGVTKTKCRFDHFDNPKMLTLNVYAKNTDPKLCTFEANSCRLKVRIVYGIDRLDFEREFCLFGTIDPRYVLKIFLKHYGSFFYKCYCSANAV